MAKDIRGKARKIEAEVERHVEADQRQILTVGKGVGLVLLGAAVVGIALVAIRPDLVSPVYDDADGAHVGVGGFHPPAVSAIPAGAEGEAIKRAIAMFNDTGVAAAPYVGNGLACKNCHIDSGRKAGAAPMWAAWVKFPEFYARDGSITTIDERIKGCFVNSMNAQDSPSGGPPPPDSAIYKDMQMYFAWLAKGAKVGAHLKGGGFPMLKEPAQGYDPGRGKQVFQQYCAACHGSNGQGARQPDGTVVYPPLWGPHSYNWDAGMAMVNMAAAFIRYNMPFDQKNVLTDQQAWDVSAYINSQERPKSPTQTGTVAENAAKNFTGFPTYYGKTVDGRLLGTGAPGSGPYPRTK